MQTLFSFIQSFDKQRQYNIFAKKGTSLGYLLSKLKLEDEKILIICENDDVCQAIWEELKFFQLKTYMFPSLEIMPYSKIPPQPENLGRRMATIYALTMGENAFYIASLQSLVEPLMPPHVLRENYLYLLAGEEYDYKALLDNLMHLGYERVEQVETVGEFSVKGGVVDLFTPLYQNPIRLEFFGDNIESMRFFNPETQRSYEACSECVVLPVKNFVLREDYIERAIEHLKNYCDERAIEKRQREQYSEALANKMFFPGIDYLFPILYGERTTLLDFAHFRKILYHSEQFGKKSEEILDNIRKAYKYHKERSEFVPEPEDCFNMEIVGGLTKDYLINFSSLLEGEEGIELDFEEISEFYEARMRVFKEGQGKGNYHPIEILKEVIGEKGNIFKFLVVAHKRHQAEKIKELLQIEEVDTKGIVKGFPDFEKMAKRGELYLTYGRPISGFKNYSEGLFVITEEELFGISNKKKEVRPKTIGEAISTIYELKEGDLVVHIDHGIGIFKGLKQVNVLGKIGEYIELEYADNGKLFVPVQKINLIQKYIASEDHVAKIDKLGEKRWQKVKKKAKEDLKKWAEEIIKVEALRRTKEGFAFPINRLSLEEFSATFEYEETEDQKRAIEETLADMEQKRPMDRIICGDVGFGKTEVAIRASFVACEANKQVAVIAPTTVLVEQHYEVFSKRFSPFNYRVEMLSRFVDKKKEREILEDLKKGLVHIIIGTHRLLSKDVVFKDLGLLVIDEEHKFGVSHKEKLKKIKADIDVLTLSATPIPRTMQMSLSGLKNISIIASPPEGRLAIRTYVTRFSPEVIKDAIEREIQRGGQVFFIHNRIKSIYRMKRFLETIVPYVDITVAHGRMDENELEEVMSDFKKGNSQVLLCTAIVESGLDIPNANTIIVNRADKFGLADLYQLRGRVGRSTRRAYAYFLVPSFDTITKDALKRLKIIQELEELGVGFRLAIHDLEIRGAGDLLGKRQSGHINEVGLELYMQLLDEAIRELRYESGEMKPEEKIIETEVNLPFPAYIPEHYISSSRERLEYYKKIFAAKSVSELEAIEEEMYDRFGKGPFELKSFFYQRFLEIALARRGVERLSLQNGTLSFSFHQDFFPPKNVITAIAKRGHNVKYLPPEKIYITLPTKEFNMDILKKILHDFMESVNIGH